MLLSIAIWALLALVLFAPTLLAWIHEGHKDDPRFARDKLGYRS